MTHQNAQPSTSSRPTSSKGIQPLSKARCEEMLTAVAIVLDVVKLGSLAKNNCIYDIITVTDEGLNDPASTNKDFRVKIFHNDSRPWPVDCKPKKGQVMLMQVKVCEYGGKLEGNAKNTNMFHICKRDEHNKLTWHSSSKNVPNNIGNVDEVAKRLFQWWANRGSNLNHRQIKNQLPVAYPDYTISSAADCTGFFTLYCQVMKKSLYPSPSAAMGVLKVRDGTRSSYQFLEITYNPMNELEVEENQRVYGVANSEEVDILVCSNIMPPELENLQVGSLVRLRGVQCIRLFSRFRRLTFTLVTGHEYLKVMKKDDPCLPSVIKELQQARTLSDGDTSKRRRLDLCTPISTYYDAFKKLKEIKGARKRYSINKKLLPLIYPQKQLKFHTEVFGKAKETSLKTFSAKGNVGEVHRVNAVITAIRVITRRENRKQPLPGGKKKQQQELVPYYTIMVVVKDSTSDLQLTSWLTTQNAIVFFDELPDLWWIKNQHEIQEMVEDLISPKCALALGIVKKEVEGKINFHIINTILRSTSTYSTTTKCPHTQPLTASPPHPQPHPASPTHPQPHPASPPHPQPHPASPPHPQPHPASPSHTQPLSVSPPYSQPPSSNPLHSQPSQATPSHTERPYASKYIEGEFYDTPLESHCSQSQCYGTPLHTQSFITPPQPEPFN